MDENVKAEWSRLKELMSRLDGQALDAERFKWRAFQGAQLPDSLILGDVVSSFHCDEGVAPHVHFRRRSPEPGKTWHGPSPVPLLTWSLEPSTKGAAFAWMVRESSQVDDPSAQVNIFANPEDGLTRGTFLPEELAKQIQSRLIEHYREYQERGDAARRTHNC